MMSEDQMNRLFKHISKEVGSVRDALNDFKAEVYHRFDQIELRLDAIEKRLDEHDARFEAIDARFEQIDARFEAIDARFEQIDMRFNAIDAQFEENALIQNEILNAIGSAHDSFDRRITKLEQASA